MLMIDPGACSRISGSAFWQPMKIESTLTEKQRFQSLNLQVSILPATPIPALLTRTLSPPNESRAAAIAASQSSALVTSCLMEKAVPAPRSALIAAAVSAAPSPLMSEIGRASCREGVWQYVLDLGGGVSLKK